MPLAVPLPNLMSQAMASHTLQAEEDAHGAQDAQAEERAQAKDGEGERALTQVGGGGLSVQAWRRCTESCTWEALFCTCSCWASNWAVFACAVSQRAQPGVPQPCCTAVRQAMRRRNSRTPVQEERDAAARLRAWQKLELDALELYAHMMRQCASWARPPAGKRLKNKASRRGKGKAKKAAESEEDEEGSPVTPAKRRRQEAAPAPSAATAAAAADGGGGEGSAQAPGSAAAPAAAGGSSEKPSKEVLEAQVGGQRLLALVGRGPPAVGGHAPKGVSAACAHARVQHTHRCPRPTIRPLGCRLSGLLHRAARLPVPSHACPRCCLQLDECLAALDRRKAELGLQPDGVSDGRLVRQQRLGLPAWGRAGW